jgi:GxxExxY protein
VPFLPSTGVTYVFYPENPVDPVKNIMEYKELTAKIIGCAYKVFNQLGFGFLESVYKKAMIIELSKDNLNVESEKPLNVYYDDQIVGSFYIDLFVEDQIIVELKSVQYLVKAHEVQLVNYLKGLKKDIGLLINFGPTCVEVKRKYRKNSI